ncbi:hypothetical protein SNE40_008424 [Patella caerulea]|uniref:GON domain-containing protein n=1 Tax=Patella caerulea TaxID=87958 RepID=A0AAN8K851_PATCE
MKSSVCNSISFELDTGKCYLYERNVSQYHLETVNGFISTDRFEWTDELLESCNGHTCPNNTLCVSSSSGPSTCDIVGCYTTSELEPVLTLDQLVYPVGYTLENGCMQGYYSNSSVVCQSDGVWSSFICLPYPRGCDELRQCNSSYKDGDYWLFHQVGGQTKKMKIYCHELNSIDPTAYITLQYPNTASTSVYKYVNNATCNVTAFSASEILTKSLGETVFHKVSVDTLTLKLVRLRSTFANFTHFTKYAMAKDCTNFINPTCPSLGTFVIDLRNTGFVIQAGATWTLSGDSPKKIDYTNFTEANQVVHGRCGGSCGGCNKNGLYVEINEALQPDIESAVFPVCT